MGTKMESRPDVATAYSKSQKCKMVFLFPNWGIAISICSVLLCSFSYATKITNQVPFIEDPLLHINRTLTTTYLQSSPILDNYFSFPDMLLFSGISLDEISQLSDGEVPATTSSSLISSGGLSTSTQFIVLEQSSHFLEICNQTNRPVHWFHFHDVQKRLLMKIESRGQYSKVFAKLIIQEKSKEHEDVLLKEIGKEDDGIIIPTCIISSRPVDNSRFLSHMGGKLNRMYPDRNVTVIKITELVKKSKEISPTAKEDPAEILVRTELAFEGTERSELLFDGLQELGSSDDRQIFFDILEAIKNQLKFTRVWVTTSGFANELENALGLNCQQLEPVNEQDQVGFLVGFWSRNSSQKLDHGKLEQFANISLQSANSQQLGLPKVDNSIFDKLVLTRLLAEVMQEDAVKYAGKDFHNVTDQDSNQNSKGIAALYANWVKLKFGQYLNSANTVDGNSTILNEEELMRMHCRLSLDYRFPGQFEKIKELFGDVKVDEIMKVGIVHVAEYPNRTTFVDDTVADYFIAQFLLNHNLMRDGVRAQLMGSEWVDFVTKGPLATYPWYMHSASNCESFCDSIRSFIFEIPGIGYFLEEFLDDSKSIFDEKSSLSSTSNLQIAHACATSNNIKIYKQFHQLGAFENGSNSIFDKDLLLVSIMESCLDFVKLTLSEFKKHHNFEDEELMDRKILVRGVHRGDLQIMEHLLGDPQLAEVNTGEMAQFIFFECLERSKDDPDEVINGKVGIIGLLAEINPKVVKKKLFRSAPLHAKDIHVRLQIELIRLGANVFALDNSRGRKRMTIIHVDSESHLSAEDYHLLIMSIPMVKLQALVEFPNDNDEKPLPTLLRHLDPLPETIAKFAEVGAEIEFDRYWNAWCYLDKKDCSILGIAIGHGRTLATLKTLIDYGANVTVRGGDGTTLLHLAAKEGMLSTTKFLFGTGLFDVNVKDDLLFTPLDKVIRNIWSTNYKTGMFLLGLGGTIEDGQELFIRATKDKDATKVKLLLHLGVDVNGMDGDGNSPLHNAVDKRLYSGREKYFFLVLKLLLDQGVNPTLTNSQGKTPLQVALESSRELGNDGRRDVLDFEIVELLRNKSEVLWTPSLATLALVNLVAMGNLPSFNRHAMEYISHGADLKFVGKEEYEKGTTLLHLAVNRGNERAVRFLIENGADVNSMDQPILAVNSQTPMEIIKMLVENGADVHARDSYYKFTFLHNFIVSFKIPVPSSSQFHSVAEYIVEKNHSRLFNVIGGRPGREGTPFQLAQQYVRIYDKTLILLKANGVPEETVAGDGYTNI